MLSAMVQRATSNMLILGEEYRDMQLGSRIFRISNCSVYYLRILDGALSLYFVSIRRQRVRLLISWTVINSSSCKVQLMIKIDGQATSQAFSDLVLLRL
ncbi:hypothetical protein SASPL_121947 [Salvia splendens]|uniref:Uncharacterized protein n=1 Tax=Salvia splendens TaxID=180675 RepID=A0A8X8XM22_SALSN|nr:hypothetical protein SASPL_121947 [Salvia splendens]